MASGNVVSESVRRQGTWRQNAASENAAPECGVSEECQLGIRLEAGMRRQEMWPQNVAGR